MKFTHKKHMEMKWKAFFIKKMWSIKKWEKKVNIKIHIVRKEMRKFCGSRIVYFTEEYDKKK